MHSTDLNCDLECYLLAAPHQPASSTYGGDSSRLLARNIDEPDDGVSRATSRRHTNAHAPYYMRDIEPDTQFIEADGLC